jgi:WD40 repeat protein
MMYNYATIKHSDYSVWPSMTIRSCFAPDGSKLYTSDTSGFDIFDANTGKVQFHGLTRSRYCTSLHISHDGKWLLFASDDGKIEVLSTLDNSSLKCFQAHTGSVGAAQFSADDRLIISSGEDSTIKFWDAKTFALLATIHGPDRFTGVEIADDGKDLLGITQNALIDYDSLPAGLAVGSAKSTAEEFSLDQNYPNPFHDQSTIEYSVPSATHVSVRIVDELGRTIGDIISANVQAGKHSVTLTSKMLPAQHGVYFYEMTTRFGAKAKMFQVW